MYKTKFTSIILISFFLLPGCFEAPIEEDNDVFFGIDIDSKDVPMFTLINENSTEFNLTEFEGKVVVISFVFTRCPDVCPVVVQSLKWLSQQFPEEYHSELEILAITVDPWLDTPEAMGQWKENMSADWNFLSWDVDPDNDGTFNPEEVWVMEDVWGAFNVGLQTYKANEENNTGTSARHHPYEYFVDHSTSTFILDKNLKQRVEWMDLDWVPELVVKDVRILLDE
jgi:protein SCO1/2